MNITTVEDKKRVICEHSYYRWWQMESPSFKDVLEKICKECGSPDPPLFDDISQVISCSMHGVEITVDYSDPKAVKTKIRCQSAKHDWVSLNAQESDLHIPYFQEFLRNIRDVWYKQYRADTGV
jgi:hypothetical protein